MTIADRKNLVLGCFVCPFVFNRFEIVKSVGSTISKVKLPEGQAANAQIIRHIAGTGPIYIRSLLKTESDEVKCVVSVINIVIRFKFNLNVLLVYLYCISVYVYFLRYCSIYITYLGFIIHGV